MQGWHGGQSWGSWWAVPPLGQLPERSGLREGVLLRAGHSLPWGPGPHWGLSFPGAHSPVISLLSLRSQPPAAGDLRACAAIPPHGPAPWLLPPYSHASTGLRGSTRAPCRPPGTAWAPWTCLPLGHDFPVPAYPLRWRQGSGAEDLPLREDAAVTRPQGDDHWHSPALPPMQVQKRWRKGGVSHPGHLAGGCRGRCCRRAQSGTGPCSPHVAPGRQPGWAWASQRPGS